MKNVGKEKKVRQKRGEIFPPLRFRGHRTLFLLQCDSRKGGVGDPPTKKDRDKSTQLELLRLNLWRMKKVNSIRSFVVDEQVALSRRAFPPFYYKG